MLINNCPTRYFIQRNYHLLRYKNTQARLFRNLCPSYVKFHCASFSYSPRSEHKDKNSPNFWKKLGSGTVSFLRKNAFIFRVYSVDMLKIRDIFPAYKRYKTDMTPLYEKEYREAVKDIIRLIPVLLLLLIPGGELLIPVILIKFPSLLPKSIKYITRSKKDCYTNLFEKVALYWDSMYRVKLKRIQQKLSLGYLKGAELDTRISEISKHFTIKELCEIVGNIDVDHFLHYSSPIVLKMTCREMGLSNKGNRKEILYRVLNKSLKLKNADQELYMKQEEIEALTDIQLIRLCVARGINCLGTDRSRMIKRLRRWLYYSIDRDIHPIYLFMTRILCYDPDDHLIEIFNNPTSDLAHGLKLFLKYEPSLQPDYQFIYYVGVLKSILKSYNVHGNGS